ncbi:hypothetical protein DICPUDRAFT_158938 [Dictyostelium purpureum]|uniref:SAP domain-containing protein n=1 Tax=Dictyostelium purpureum TaxID=5786 RepID=F1A2V8_DICPU|nr:uncharacterized protein DICPUDRAFT_158938 [Dictyostelium purpureum]EGC29475.1 hypothetical protein DICPUDRAFT_158938 [Dictyostelium purpureum]|eukprot:XP_003294004.1 hypothetical protein DICPUDRAFT_158938 [Dictyostelium purpureum]
MGLKIIDGSIVNDENSSSTTSSPSHSYISTSSPMVQPRRRNSIASLSDFRTQRNKINYNNSNNEINQLKKSFNEINVLNGDNNNNNNNNNINDNNNSGSFFKKFKIYKYFEEIFSIIIFKNPTMVQIIDTLELSTKIFNVEMKLKYLVAICIFTQILFKSWGLLISLLIFYLGTFYNKLDSSINNNNKKESEDNSTLNNSNNNINIRNSNNSLNNSFSKINTLSSSNNKNINLSKSSPIQTNNINTLNNSGINYQKQCTCNKSALSKSSSRIQTLSSPLLRSCSYCSPPSPFSLSSSLPSLATNSRSFNNANNNNNYTHNEEDEDWEEYLDSSDEYEDEDDEESLSSSPAYYLYNSPNLRQACNKVSILKNKRLNNEEGGSDIEEKSKKKKKVDQSGAEENTVPDSEINSDNKTNINNGNEENNNSSSTNSCNNNNNNINNNTLNYDVFINNSYKLNELKEISNSLGLPAKGKKDEMYERIKDLLLYQKSLINEANQKEAINSFNKTQELLIKDIDPLEVSFWKVFRNKYLFNFLFSNFIFKSANNYQMIYSVHRIFHGYSNAAEILKDKVKRGDFLTFKHLHSYANDGYYLTFKNIQKENQENKNFYDKFFKNYCSTEGDKSIIKNIFSTNNILAFKLFIPRKDILNKVGLPTIASYKSFKMVHHLYKEGWNTSRVSHIIKIVKNIGKIRKGTTTKAPPFLEITDPAIGFTEQQLNSSIHDLLDTTSVLINNSIANNKNTTNGDSEGHKDYIAFLDSLFLNGDQRDKIVNLLLEKDKYINTLESIIKKENLSSELNKEISTNANINENKTTITDFDNEKTNLKVEAIGIDTLELKSLILQSLDYLYSFQSTIPINYYILFKEKDQIIEELKVLSNNLNSSISGYYQQCLDVFRMGKYRNIQSPIFSDFFKDITKICEKNDMGPIFKSIIETNNIDFINYLLRDNTIVFFKNLPAIFEGIKSTAVLDYFFKKYQDVFFSSNNSNWIYISDFSIIEHYENLMESLKRTFSISEFESNKGKGMKLELGLELLIRALSNPNLYHLPEEVNLSIFSNIFSNYLNENKQVALFISLFKFNRFGTIPLADLFKKYGGERLYLIGDWLFKNQVKLEYYNSYFHNLQVNSGNGIIHFFISTSMMLDLLRQTGRFDDISKLENLSVFQILERVPPCRANQLFLDMFFKFYLENQTEDTYCFKTYYYFSNIILDFGNFQFLKYLALKHGNILIKKQNNTKGVFSTKEIKKLLERALKLKYVEIADLLLNYIKMTECEFKKIVNKEESFLYKSLINKIKK